MMVKDLPRLPARISVMGSVFTVLKRSAACAMVTDGHVRTKTVTRRDTGRHEDVTYEVHESAKPWPISLGTEVDEILDDAPVAAAVERSERASGNREEAYAMFKAGKSTREIHEHFGGSIWTIRAWIREMKRKDGRQ